MAFDFAGLKQSFFDSEKVTSAVDKGKRRALSRCAAFVWRRDKSSLRYRKRASLPGEPPSVHRSPGFTKSKTNKKTGETTRQQASPLRELTFFAYDDETKTAVVGPAVFDSSRVGGGVAPRALEVGGESVKKTRRGPKVITVQARPHTFPAMEAEAPKFPEQFKGIFE